MGIITGDRGQSEVVGAILLFGIFILAIGLLQTYFVPQEIAATEQNHVEEVSDDFTELYTAIGDAAGSNKERSASISLGTRYGVSTVFLTPPPARGTIESEHVGNLSSDNGDEFAGLGDELVNEVCGLSTVKTNAITYEARYNEYQNAGAHTYEAGVHYRITDGAGLKNSQRLVDGKSDVTTIHLTPITNGSIRESGTSREPITFKPGVTGDTGTFAGNSSDPVSIEIPVRNSDGWNASFDDSVLVNTSSSHANLTFDNSSQDYRIRCTPIGINTNLGNEPADEFTGEADNEEEDSGGINPIGEGALVLQGGSTVTNLTFQNNADSIKNVTAVRIPWVQNPGQVADTIKLDFEKNGSTIPVATGSTSWNETGGWEWEEEGRSEDVKQIGVDLGSSSESSSESSSDNGGGNGGGNPNRGYAIVFQFEDGTTATYLVSG
jgi:hypothetical protein